MNTRRPTPRPRARRVSADGGRDRVLVVGVGNLDRGDDGVGRVVARRLRALAPRGLVVREADGAATELLDAFEGWGRVVVVDACASGAAPGTWTCFDAVAAPLPASLARASTHGWGVAEAVELARALGRLPRSLVVVAIEGRTFEPGAALSPAVQAAARHLAEALGAGVTPSLTPLGARAGAAPPRAALTVLP